MSAVDFLLLPGIQKVLGQTYSHLDQDFTLNELLANAPGGRGTNQRHIDRLIQAGVLTEGPRRARQRAIRANTNYFLFDELRSIALKTFALKEPLQAALHVALVIDRRYRFFFRLQDTGQALVFDHEFAVR